MFAHAAYRARGLADLAPLGDNGNALEPIGASAGARSTATKVTLKQGGAIAPTALIMPDKRR